MTNQNNVKRFIHIIDKIPMFQGLKPGQALEILKMCRPQVFSDRATLLAQGSRSTEMYILLSGKLVVTAPDGTPLTHLTPVTMVGEMGVITGQPRSANVIAEEKASVFEISKLKFDILLKKYPDIGFKVYRNVIDLLSQRLDNNNKLRADSQREVAQLRDQASAQPAV